MDRNSYISALFRRSPHQRARWFAMTLTFSVIAWSPNFPVIARLRSSRGNLPVFTQRRSFLCACGAWGQKGFGFLRVKVYGIRHRSGMPPAGIFLGSAQESHQRMRPRGGAAYQLVFTKAALPWEPHPAARYRYMVPVLGRRFGSLRGATRRGNLPDRRRQ